MTQVFRRWYDEKIYIWGACVLRASLCPPLNIFHEISELPLDAISWNLRLNYCCESFLFAFLPSRTNVESYYAFSS